MTSLSGESNQPAVAAAGVDPERLRFAAGAGVVLLIALGWLFWDFFLRQVRWAVDYQADWGHTLVIPLIAAYFVYLRRHELLREPFRTTWVGLVPVVLGVAWYVTCTLGPVTLHHHNTMGAGVAMTLFGLVLLFFGFRAMRWLWFPLLYLVVFGQTISERLMNIVTFELQDLTARGSHLVLMLLGLDVDRLGNTLLVFDEGVSKELNIAEACSGMRMLMAFLALGVAMAYTGLRRFWQQAALVILAVPTAIVVNILRVVTLAMLSLVDADFAAGDFHTFIGLVWLMPAFLIYLGLMWILRRLVVEESEAARGGEVASDPPTR
ncbi:MAG: exosortase/archaeosortase family protein [Planctomycetota bacterium]|jgi:exosortase